MARRSGSVYLYHSKPDQAGPLIAQLEKAGFEVTLAKEAKAQQVLASGAQAVVIDLSKIPSNGGYVAAWIRGTKSIRHLPIVFVNGEASKVKAIQQKVPDAVYANTQDLVDKLRDAIETGAPPTPVIPRQMMESSRTTVQKLGIRPGDQVALLNAPPDYEKILGPLPGSLHNAATIIEDSVDNCSIVIWFVDDASEFERMLTERRTLAAKHKLWIAWSKGSKDGLNSNLIRESALRVGLVDHKVCSMNDHWSAIAFAVKKSAKPR